MRKRPDVEMALKEVDEVDRQVRDNGVSDVAANVEPLCGRRLDQLGRHDALRSAAHYHAAAEFRVWLIDPVNLATTRSGWGPLKADPAVDHRTLAIAVNARNRCGLDPMLVGNIITTLNLDLRRGEAVGTIAERIRQKVDHSSKAPSRPTARR